MYAIRSYYERVGRPAQADIYRVHAAAGQPRTGQGHPVPEVAIEEFPRNNFV